MEKQRIITTYSQIEKEKYFVDIVRDLIYNIYYLDLQTKNNRLNNNCLIIKIN